jgi:hypothetical protein
VSNPAGLRDDHRSPPIGVERCFGASRRIRQAGDEEVRDALGHVLKKGDRHLAAFRLLTIFSSRRAGSRINNDPPLPPHTKGGGCVAEAESQSPFFNCLLAHCRPLEFRLQPASVDQQPDARPARPTMTPPNPPLRRGGGYISRDCQRYRISGNRLSLTRRVTRRQVARSVSEGANWGIAFTAMANPSNGEPPVRRVEVFGMDLPQPPAVPRDSSLSCHSVRHVWSRR